MEEGADVSKAEDDAASNGLAGVPTAEQAIRLAHHPARTHTQPCTHTESLWPANGCGNSGGYVDSLHGLC